MMALRVLGLIGPDAAHTVPAIVGLLEKEDASLKVAALEALARMGPAAGKAGAGIAGMLKDEDPGVRTAAVWLDFVDDLHGPDLRRAGHRTRRQTRPQGVERRLALGKPPAQPPKETGSALTPSSPNAQGPRGRPKRPSPRSAPGCDKLPPPGPTASRPSRSPDALP